ncbi:MAG TPA: DUF4845 domain-containing protein [Gammaproteobacteria bacterium]|jgi:hypothetical protein|nr:DUF4845 domain-containing protein [Gammaproteobacteria bacterium]
MSKRKYQSGLTMITWIILIAMIGFIGVFGFKLMPIYLEYNSINNSLTTVSKQVTSGETPAQIRSNISSLLDVNSVSVIKADDVEIKQDPDTKALVMNLDYDARTNFIANIDLVVHFEKTYTANAH